MPIWTPQHNPSFKQGFARSASESANPGLWKGLGGVWMPSLGPTGLTLRDISGHDHHGILTNMDPATDWVMTKKGWALDFDGVNDHVLVPHNPVLNPANALTLSAWIKPGITAADGVLTKGPLNNNFGAYSLDVRYNGTLRFTLNNNVANINPVSPTPTTGKWSHVIATYNRVNLRLFLDGVDIGNAAYVDPIDSNVNPVYIGNTYANIGGTFHFTGAIGTCQIYDRVLAPSEIQQLYQDPYALVRQRARVFPAAAVAGMTYRKQYILGGGIL